MKPNNLGSISKHDTDFIRNSSTMLELMSLINLQIISKNFAMFGLLSAKCYYFTLDDLARTQLSKIAIIHSRELFTENR